MDLVLIFWLALTASQYDVPFGRVVAWSQKFPQFEVVVGKAQRSAGSVFPGVSGFKPGSKFGFDFVGFTPHTFYRRVEVLPPRLLAHQADGSDLFRRHPHLIRFEIGNLYTAVPENSPKWVPDR